MPATGRNTTPQGKDTRPPRQRAQRPLQRRLRHALGYVDWPDVAVSLLLSLAVDTLGGSDAIGVMIALLVSLLPEWYSGQAIGK